MKDKIFLVSWLSMFVLVGCFLASTDQTNAATPQPPSNLEVAQKKEWSFPVSKITFDNSFFSQRMIGEYAISNFDLTTQEDWDGGIDCLRWFVKVNNIECATANICKTVAGVSFTKSVANTCNVKDGDKLQFVFENVKSTFPESVITFW